MLDSTRAEIARSKSQIHKEIEQEVVQRMYAVLATILKRTPSDAVLQSAKNSWEELKQKLR
jgi:hypothetical protein